MALSASRPAPACFAAPVSPGQSCPDATDEIEREEHRVERVAPQGLPRGLGGVGAKTRKRALPCSFAFTKVSIAPPDANTFSVSAREARPWSW